MAHTLHKRDGVRTKQIFYAPEDVRVFIESQAKGRVLSKSEVVVQIIQESWQFKRREIKHGRL